MNPLFNTNNSPNNSTQPTKSVNRQGVNVMRTHNTFDMSYFNFKTQKFGQYEPFFAMEAVPGDKIPLSNSHNIRTLPMSSPFLSQLTLNKDFFLCPMNAILPNTWDYIFRKPSDGDDVPDDANCLFPAWSMSTSTNFLKELWSYIQSTDASDDSIIRCLLIMEMFFSSGSLLQQMGYHLNPVFRYSPDGTKWYQKNFDQLFDDFWLNLSELTFRYKNKTYIYRANFDDNYNIRYVNKYQALSMLRSYGSEIQSITFQTSDESYKEYSLYGYPVFQDLTEFGADINISRLLAYQIACQQFYVNPQVDFLYNAQLYRDNLFSLLKIAYDENASSLTPGFFSMNGIMVPYDYASGYYFNLALKPIVDGTGLNEDNSYISHIYDYFYAIFGFRESLKFGDYFTDSRTTILAPGDDMVSVSTDGVSTIDMSKSIVYQRFRNAVVKLGNTASDYLRGIFGTNPAPDVTEPKFIAHQDFNVSGFEVANQTPEGQGDMVTNLSSREDTYCFEVDIDVPSIIIGISYFSLPRTYMQSKERHFFHRDRYDMFNPMLQYIGDQAVYSIERSDVIGSSDIFGYQSRNNEYKQRYSVVSGGFATKLPAWAFVADSIVDPIDDIILEDNQNPDYIRAHDYEFNRFFAQLSGFSMANSFHFIMVYNNKTMCNRPMEVNPNTL